MGIKIGGPIRGHELPNIYIIIVYISHGSSVIT